MDLNQFQDLIPLFSGAIGGAVSSGALTGPIKSLEEWWYVTFGHGISTKAELLRVTRDANVEKLKQEILKEVSNIQPENLQEPSIKILGPALEASKYYIDEKELRVMFAKIISATFDTNQNQNLHSSFVEVIKQLDTLDAQILQYLKDKNIGVASAVPTMYINLEFSTNSRGTVVPLIFLTPEFNDISRNSISLDNLERLGIIKLENEKWLSDDNHYHYIENHPTVRHMLNSNSSFKLEKSCFRLTDYGVRFINICTD